MDLRQYQPMRRHILDMIDDGIIALKDAVAAAQHRDETHEFFPNGRLTNDVRHTKVDLGARCEVGWVPGRCPQRNRRWRD